MECDNTFVRLSYKGYDLEDEEYPEVSPFDIIDFVPRQAKKRGERNTYQTKNTNSVDVFTAIDDRGHCIARYVGIGAASATKLQRAVPSSKYLLSIPSKDPFAYSNKTPTAISNIGETLLVSDEEKAIGRYASKIGIPHESHDYSKNGKQLALPEGAHNIQRVNALHHRLKTFLRKSNYVSSKYLPGYLTLFEFIENTGATPEAIGRLFEILTTPGLGNPPEFYKNLYTIPNLYVECGNEDIKKLKHNQLLAAFMYHRKKEAEVKGKASEITMKNILEVTGYSSPSTVRRIYKNIVYSNLMDDVCKAMTAPDKVIKEETKRADIPRVPDHIYKYYDEFCAMLRLPLCEQCSHRKFIDILNEKYGQKVSRPAFYYYADRIEKFNLRQTKLSELKADNRQTRLSKSYMCPPRAPEILQIYNDIRISYISEGEPLPPRAEMLNMVAQKTGLSPYTVEDYIAAAKSMQKDKLK